MGGLPRKQPPRAVGHRREFVVTFLDVRGDFEFIATHWTDDMQSASDRCLSAGANRPEIFVRRADFERLEREGRAVDLCAPGVMPGRG